MAEIVLSTLNARYAHASLALRYLAANLGQHRERAAIREFVIQERPVDIAEAILSERPRVVGLGVYIWNAKPTLELVRILKSVAPDVRVVLGGPEVSHEWNEQEIVALADHVVTGEGEVAFRTLCDAILGNGSLPKRLPGGLPDLKELFSPYSLYDERDIESRVVYVEASRGCPFSCEFCLSSLDQKVRSFPLDKFLGDMEVLYERGVRQFKFIDRTFNLKMSTSRRILDFFRERADKDLFVHFEMIPDRLPSALREAIRAFPPGSLQFEVGIQTFDEPTAKRISRAQDRRAIDDNLRFLRSETGVHVHADLIVGLPGEDVTCFGKGFDQLVQLGPQEIQVGILKRLRGTPIARHSEDWGMIYSSSPPYEILANNLIPFPTMQRLKRFARAWDLVANSGNFRDTLPLIWAGESPFLHFMGFADWLGARIGAFSGIALLRLTRLLFEFLTEKGRVSETTAAEALAMDYVRPGRSVPGFLPGI